MYNNMLSFAVYFSQKLTKCIIFVSEVSNKRALLCNQNIVELFSVFAGVCVTGKYCIWEALLQYSRLSLLRCPINQNAAYFDTRSIPQP